MCNSAIATEGVDGGTKLGEWRVYYAVVKVHVVLGGGCVISRVYNRKSVQLPYGFYTHHLDRMM